ncbi:unnamed protein product [Protopolystoma xenopodis]|uniref:Uncharacterized protein n=1 Tax=Protopolystoma xenopodis TaxID=117903 RepID=A0A3S4ZVF6_9PLAT|nr:unnamed protein product [Protopolystoma xenopodis]
MSSVRPDSRRAMKRQVIWPTGAGENVREVGSPSGRPRPVRHKSSLHQAGPGLEPSDEPSRGHRRQHVGSEFCVFTSFPHLHRLFPSATLPSPPPRRRIQP